MQKHRIPSKLGLYPIWLFQVGFGEIPMTNLAVVEMVFIVGVGKRLIYDVPGGGVAISTTSLHENILRVKLSSQLKALGLEWRHVSKADGASVALAGACTVPMPEVMSRKKFAVNRTKQTNAY